MTNISIAQLLNMSLEEKIESFRQGYMISADPTQTCGCGNTLSNLSQTNLAHNTDLKLLGTCTAGSAAQGDTLNMTTTITGGTPPYSVVFYKVSPSSVKTTLYVGSITSSGGSASYNYTIPSNEVLGGWSYGITATDNCNGGGANGKQCTTSCTVTVVSAPILTSITISPTNPIINTGSQKQFAATCYKNTNIVVCPTLVWISSNTSAATINSTTGLATGVGGGSTLITATHTLSGISGSTTLVVICDTPSCSWSVTKL